MVKHKATRIINSKGWNIEEACERWGIRLATYNARCNSFKAITQLEDMCRGLEDRLND